MRRHVHCSERRLVAQRACFTTDYGCKSANKRIYLLTLLEPRSSTPKSRIFAGPVTRWSQMRAFSMLSKSGTSGYSIAIHSTVHADLIKDTPPSNDITLNEVEPRRCAAISVIRNVTPNPMLAPSRRSDWICNLGCRRLVVVNVKGLVVQNCGRR